MWMDQASRLGGGRRSERWNGGCWVEGSIDRWCSGWVGSKTAAGLAVDHVLKPGGGVLVAGLRTETRRSS